MRVCYIVQLKKERERKGGRETDSWRSKKLQHHQIWCNTSVLEGHSGTQPGLGIRLFYLNSSQMDFHLNVPWETPSISAFVSTLRLHYKLTIDSEINFSYLILTQFLLPPNVTHGCPVCFIASLCLSVSSPTDNQSLKFSSLEAGAGIWRGLAHHELAIPKAIHHQFSALDKVSIPVPISVAGKGHKETAKIPFLQQWRWMRQFP